MNKIVVIILLLTACSKEDTHKTEPVPDYLVFGQYYGECIGNKCVLIYKLTSTALYADQTKHYPSSTSVYSGNYLLQADSSFVKVKDLMNKVPQELIVSGQRVIGQPDYTDGGGIYIELSTQGKVQYWLIDKNTNNLPAYLIPFVVDVNQNIKLINN